MSSFLLILASGEKKQIPLTDEKLHIGRLPACDIALSEPTVSRKHAEVYLRNNRCYIQDCGSANGTQVNQHQIHDATELFPGDTVKIGTAKLIYQAPERQPELTELESSDRTIILSLPKDQPTEKVLAPFGLLEIMAEIAKEIVKNRPLAQSQSIILQLCVEKTSADRAALLLRNTAGVLIPQTYYSHATGSAEFTFSQSIAQKAIDEKRAILVEDAITPNNQDLGESVFNLQIRSAICTPLWKDDQTVGALYVDTNRPDRLFKEIDLLFFSCLSGMLAEKIALSAFEQIAKDKQRIDAELEIASDIQSMLFPQKLPQIEGYQLAAVNYPCSEVGGDYFDMIATDNRYGIAIGDVTGKGVGAALLMSNLQALLRVRAAEVADTAELLTKMNNDLYERVGSDRFITFCYLMLDPQNGTVKYSNAGHNRPLWRKHSGEVQALEVSGLPLGILAKEDYTSHQINLEPGEYVLLYSDGLTECRNKDDDMFGETRLERFVANLYEVNPQIIIKKLVAEVDQFRQGQAYSDDLTLVVLSRM